MKNVCLPIRNRSVLPVRWAALAILIAGILLPLSPTRAQDATPQSATPIAATGDFDGLIDIGNGRHLYLTCRGSGSPTVLLEAGAGNNAQIWDQLALPPDSDKEAVFPAVASFTRVCAYDRPGTLLDDDHLSRSDPVSGPRTAQEIVADLHALIDTAGLELPLVLAGHSFGGLVVRLYANTWPDQVAGLVMVDAAHEAYYQGLADLLSPEQYAAAFDPPPTADGVEFEALDPLSSADQVIAAQAVSPLREMPMIVLTHQAFPFPDDFPADELEAVWTSGQQQLAALVPGTPLIVATESGHYIQLTSPIWSSPPSGTWSMPSVTQPSGRCRSPRPRPDSPLAERHPHAMTNPLMQKWAATLVHFSAPVQPGNSVLIMGGVDAEPLLRAVYAEVVAAGGYPVVVPTFTGIETALLNDGTDDQLTWLTPIERFWRETADVVIRVLADSNTRALTGVDPARQAAFQGARRPLIDTFMQREIAGTLRWTITQYPTDAFAQDAEMSTEEFAAFVFNACKLDQDDPVAAWNEQSHKQQILADWLTGKKEVHLTGPGTDLKVDVTGRTWINADGRKNFPDGEVFTGPVETGTEGYVCLRYACHHPGPRGGRHPARVPERQGRRRISHQERGISHPTARYRSRRPHPRRIRFRRQLRHPALHRPAPLRREDRRHRPHGGRHRPPHHRQHQPVRHSLGHDLRPAHRRPRHRRRRTVPGRRPVSPLGTMTPGLAYLA